MKVKIDVSEYTEADEIVDRAWHEGYRAFVDGAAESANPYGVLIDGFMPWAKGWLAAEKTKKEVV